MYCFVKNCTVSLYIQYIYIHVNQGAFYMYSRLRRRSSAWTSKMLGALACDRIDFGMPGYNQGSIWCTLSGNSKQKSLKMGYKGL